MNVVVLMNEESHDFEAHGYVGSRYLLEVEGSLLLEKLNESLNSLDGKRHFLIKSQDNEKYHLEDTISIVSPESNVVLIEDDARGSICAVLFAIEHIDFDEELFIISGGQWIKSDMKSIVDYFRGQKADGGVVTFDSVHPRWTHAVLDENGFVVQTVEKRAISRHAMADCYYYSSGKDFLKACFQVLKKDVNIGGLYHISSACNEMILDQKKIVSYDIPKEEHVSFSAYHLRENFTAPKRN